MKEKIIKTNGIELCTESFGNKKNPAILLVAGATVSMLYWDTEFCQQLSEKGFFVIRYDNRDVGKSTNYEPGSTPYDIVDLTNDAISILDGYKIDKAHFVGISLGGLISQIASIKFADRVNSLTLMSFKGKQINGENLSESGNYYVMNGGTEPSGYYSDYNVEANSISISEGGNSCGYVQFNTLPFWSGGHCYSIQNIADNVNNLYLYHYLCSMY